MARPVRSPRWRRAAWRSRRRTCPRHAPSRSRSWHDGRVLVAAPVGSARRDGPGNRGAGDGGPAVGGEHRGGPAGRGCRRGGHGRDDARPAPHGGSALPGLWSRRGGGCGDRGGGAGCAGTRSGHLRGAGRRVPRGARRAGGPARQLVGRPAEPSRIGRRGFGLHPPGAPARDAARRRAGGGPDAAGPGACSGRAPMAPAQPARRRAGGDGGRRRGAGGRGHRSAAAEWSRDGAGLAGCGGVGGRRLGGDAMTRGMLAAWVRTLIVQASWNYDRMVGLGVAYAMEPLLRGLPGGRANDRYAAALKRVAGFFNAHPYLTGMAAGALARVEYDGVPEAQADRLRRALIGPLGSVGDQLVWAGWLPMSVAVGLIVA